MLECALQSVYLDNGTDAFSMWNDPPASVYMTAYVFDLINPLELAVDPSARPVFLERGPFSYLEQRTHSHLAFVSRNSSLSYRQPQSFLRPNVSDPEMDPTKVRVLNRVSVLNT